MVKPSAAAAPAAAAAPRSVDVVVDATALYDVVSAQVSRKIGQVARTALPLTPPATFSLPLPRPDNLTEGDLRRIALAERSPLRNAGMHHYAVAGQHHIWVDEVYAANKTLVGAATYVRLADRNIVTLKLSFFYHPGLTRDEQSDIVHETFHKIVVMMLESRDLFPPDVSEDHPIIFDLQSPDVTSYSTLYFNGLRVHPDDDRETAYKVPVARTVVDLGAVFATHKKYGENTRLTAEEQSAVEWGMGKLGRYGTDMKDIGIHNICFAKTLYYLLDPSFNKRHAPEATTFAAAFPAGSHLRMVLKNLALLSIPLQLECLARAPEPAPVAVAANDDLSLAQVRSMSAAAHAVLARPPQPGPSPAPSGTVAAMAQAGAAASAAAPAPDTAIDDVPPVGRPRRLTPGQLAERAKADAAAAAAGKK